MPELGQKHECSNCEAKFYDLGRSEIACPKCGEPQVAEKQAEDPKAGSGHPRRWTASPAARSKPDDDDDDAKPAAADDDEDDGDDD